MLFCAHASEYLNGKEFVELPKFVILVEQQPLSAFEYHAVSSNGLEHKVHLVRVFLESLVDGIGHIIVHFGCDALVGVVEVLVQNV